VNTAKKSALAGTVGLALAAALPYNAAAAGAPPAPWVAHTPLHVANYSGARVAAAITNPSPQGYIPCDIRTAYYLTSVGGTGSGQLVAVVDAFADPSLASDLAAFDAAFALPAPSFTQVAPYGTAATTQSNLQGWQLEEALDVEWVHSIAPGANLALVEARSDGVADLLNAIGYAVSTLHSNVVSMSWGGAEFFGEGGYDSNFPNHSGVMFLAAAGDSGSGAEWPSSSPNVVSVGGTSLSSAATGDGTSSHTTCSGTGTGSNSSLETAWSGSGGGISAFEAIPGYQGTYGGAVSGAASISALTGGKRGTPDVAAIANPVTGVAVYDTAGYQSQSGWFQVGGTSLAAPVWAAIVALADQKRASAGAPDLSIGAGQATSPLYSPAPGTFTDITSGSNGACGTNCNAGAGYDLVSGVGAPIGTRFDSRAPVNQIVGSTPPVRSPVAQSGAGATPGPRTPVQPSARLTNVQPLPAAASPLVSAAAKSPDAPWPAWPTGFFVSMRLRLA